VAESQSEVSARRIIADRAWQMDQTWQPLLRDAYDYAIPNRRPGGAGAAKNVVDRLFDQTAPTSAMHLAGTLQRLLFSEPPKLEPGALVRQAVMAEYGAKNGPAALGKLERELERTGDFIYPFMQAGDLDTSTHEMCIDLGVGTGVMIPMRGTPDQPILFFTPPADEVALSGDAWGRVNLASWRRYVQREAVLAAFPKGRFSDGFRQASKQTPNGEVMLYQDFWRLPDGRWRFAAYLDTQCDEFIASETYLTKPLTTPRYYRVAGEMRGRGPVLLALPAIKTLNKAQELTLKAAAIQMLGIWGYRAGSGFNPDTFQLAPGAFAAMQSTGGILGPDLTRLDTASGRLEVGALIIDGLQQQVRDTLMDTRLAPEQGTPRSASEIAARLRQGAQVHLGGFMRLWREVHPDIVPRCAEILHSFGYLRGLMDFNQLLVSVGVRSPMATAMSAEKVASIAQYAELMGALVGPERLPEHLVIDDAADAIADGLMIPKGMVPDAEARAEIRQAMMQQQQQQAEAQMLEKAVPQLAGGAMRMIEGGREAA
jgi:hypothetical protein